MAILFLKETLLIIVGIVIGYLFKFKSTDNSIKIRINDILSILRENNSITEMEYQLLIIEFKKKTSNKFIDTLKKIITKEKEVKDDGKERDK